jgi:competence ComEA-like helix-hairpin-helix protein
MAFDYRPPLDRKFRLHNVKMWLASAAAVIAVASAGVWLVRDTVYMGRWFDSSPAEGSLVVNINTATQEELETIPGVGEARAMQIIANRPYASVDELTRISGIGERTLETMRPFVMVSNETQPR